MYFYLDQTLLTENFLSYTKIEHMCFFQKEEYNFYDTIFLLYNMDKIILQIKTFY